MQSASCPEDELHLLKISIERSSDEVFWLDFSGRILYVNEAAERITGYSREELCSMNIAVLDPEFTPATWEASVADLREKKTQLIRSCHRRKDGTLINVEILAVYVNHGDREYSFAYVRDITERSRAEAVLREIDRKYHLLADNVHDVIWTTDKEMRFTYISPSVKALLGVTPEEAMPGSFADALTPESYRILMESRTRGLANLKEGKIPPKNLVMELEFRRRDGSTVWTDMAITPIFDRERNPAGAVGIIRDITPRRQAEQKLRESEEKLRTVLDNLPDLVLVHRDGKILYVNPAMIDNMGVDPEAVRNKPILDFVPARYHARILFAMTHRMETGKSEPYEIEIDSPVKGHRIVLVRGSVIEFNGSPAILNVLTDITEQKRMEEALRASEEKFRSYVENANDIVFSLACDGTTTYVSPNWTEILGHDTSEIIGRPVRHIHPEDLPRVWAFIQDCMATGKKGGGIEYRIRHRDGTWQWHTQNITPVYDASGKSLGVQGICHDITERKKAEEALRASEEKFRSYVENANDIIYTLTTGGIFTYVSPRWTEVLGHDARDVIGTSFEEYIHPGDLPACHAFVLEVLGSGERRSGIEYRIRHKNGTWQWHTTTASPLRDSSGNTLAFLGICRDITGRKETEEALRASEEKFRSYVENANDIIYTLTTGGVFTYLSPKLTDMLGYEAREILGTQIESLVHPDDLSACYEFIRQVITTGEKKSGIEYRLRHRNGTWQWHTTTASPLRDSTGEIVSFLGISRDITGRKDAEEALRKSRQQLADAMDIASLVDWEYDAATNLFTFNDRFYALYGTTSEREGGLQMAPDVYAREFIHPDDQYLMFVELQNLLKTTDPRYMSRVEHRIVRRDGEIRYIVVHIRVILDADGRLVRTHGANQDITERKRAERALSRANRQLSLLTGITRHDILNKIAAVHGFLSIAEMKTTDPAMGGYISRIRSATQAIQSQIEFTRVYEDLGSREPQWLNLAELISRIQIPQEVPLNTDVTGIELYSDLMLEKVFSNLLDNSIRHGERVTGIRISAHLTRGDLVIVWEDNGIGIPVEEKGRIFERGFGKNTGLGMFLAREILTLTGISISETGEPGKGARFEILVPKGVYRIT